MNNKNMPDKNQLISVGVVMVVIIILIWGFVYFNNDDNLLVDNGGVNTATSTLDAFAKCAADTGLTMYGAVWCGHCANEKKAFGSSFRFINYVECPDNIKLCLDKGINGYPTWVDGAGKKYEGEQGLAGIARITGCELPQSN